MVAFFKLRPALALSSASLSAAMCLQCRLLGAVINADRAERFRCADLSLGSFRLTLAEASSLKDLMASIHLRRSLSKFADIAGLRFTPVTVTSDGSCLPHAVSRALVGSEMYLAPTLTFY